MGEETDNVYDVNMIGYRNFKCENLNWGFKWLNNWCEK